MAQGFYHRIDQLRGEISLSLFVLCLLPLGASPLGENASLFGDSESSIHPQFDLGEEGSNRASASASYYEGLTLERAGMIDDALEAYETAFRAAPSQQRLAHRAADLAGQFRDIDRGLSILEENYRRNPSAPDAYLRLSAYLATYHENRNERLERSLEVLQEASDKFPNQPEVYQKLIEALLLRQERAEAEAVLARAMAQPSEDPQYWVEIARIAPLLHPVPRREGNDLVNGLYEKAFALSGGDLAIGTRVGDFFRITEQYDKARAVYEKVIAGHPEALEVREKLAAIFAALEDSEMVLATLLELEKINPHRQETQRRVAQIYLHRKQYSEAVDHYLKAFQIAKGSPQEYLNVAELLRFERRADEAVEMLKRARFHYPEEVELLIELAVSNIAADQFGIAFTLFQESENVAESLRPDLLDGMFYFSFGAAAERTKRYDEAESLFRKSISLTGEDVFPKVRARPFNYLGYMFLEQDKNFEEAGELIQEANDLVPNDASYVDSLGWYYFKVEEYPQALRALLRAETLLTKELESDPVIFDHIAQAYFQLGHRKEALAYIGKAIARDPDNEEYQSRKTSFEETAPPQKVPLDFLDAPQMDSSSGDGESTAPAGDEQEIPEVPNTP